MREGTNERTNERMYTTTKHITTLLLRSRVKTAFLHYIIDIDIVDLKSGTSKTKNVTTPSPRSSPSEIEGVRIVVISVRNIAKKKLAKIFQKRPVRAKKKENGYRKEW